MSAPTPDSIDAVLDLLGRQDYIADRALAAAIYLALGLERPLFLEGEAGTGKTEVAKVLARGLSRSLIRLQCYEGLDAASALYEWNYAKQLLAIKQGETCPADAPVNIFTEEFLIRRPLLEAISRESRDERVVLLIDEIDRADEEFEAFLLEILSDFTISIPEIGTLEAKTHPVVILTSNRTRDVHDALKRRCLFHWIDYPNQDKEQLIISRKTPGISDFLAGQLSRFMQNIRQLDIMKKPGLAETLDWARALLLLGRNHLDEAVVTETLGCILKYEEDIRAIQSEIPGLVKSACAGPSSG